MLIAVAIVILIVASVAPRPAPEYQSFGAGETARTLAGAPPDSDEAGARSALGYAERSRVSNPAVGANGGAPQPTVTGSAVSSPVGTLSGLATWYRWHPGEAAAGPRLRSWLGSGWRGQTVRVCSGACITVRLTDWCLCGHGRVIDLDSRSFARLGPLSAGVLRVVITRGGPVPTALPTGPPTDR